MTILIIRASKKHLMTPRMHFYGMLWDDTGRCVAVSCLTLGQHLLHEGPIERKELTGLLRVFSAFERLFGLGFISYTQNLQSHPNASSGVQRSRADGLGLEAQWFWFDCVRVASDMRTYCLASRA